MYYRIVETPPGYPAQQRYMVVAYETKDPNSKLFTVKNAGESIFSATLEEARKLIPVKAVLCPTYPIDFFVEMWKL